MQQSLFAYPFREHDLYPPRLSYTEPLASIGLIRNDDMRSLELAIDFSFVDNGLMWNT